MPLAAPSRLRRSEQAVAAEVLAKLLADRVVTGTPERIARACAAARVPVAAVEARYMALTRDAAPYEAPSDEPCAAARALQAVPAPDPELEVLRSALADAEAALEAAAANVERLEHELMLERGRVPTPAVSADRARGRRMAAKNPEPGMRRCSRCKKLKPATTEHFYVKVPRTGQLTSMCHPCRREYQQERYLSVEKLDALNRARLVFEVVEGDAVVGLVCASCGEPIVAGEKVHGEAELRHEGCS